MIKQLFGHWDNTSRYPSYVLARNMRGLIAKSLFTMLVFTLLTAFLLPFAYMTVTSVKSLKQISAGEVLPLSPATFSYQGEDLPIYNVPGTDGVTHQWALLTGRRNDSVFIDPAHPESGEIAWEGRWRTLAPVQHFDPQWDNFQAASEGINFPRLLSNTIIIAFTGMVGTLISCSLVAYGFSRFPIPG
jgi:multiple sugar transport system permease protein